MAYHSYTISSGSTVENTTLSWDDYSLFGVINNVSAVSTCWIGVSSGGTASNTTLLEGYLSVFSGGLAINTNVGSSAGMWVNNNGSANIIALNKGGNLTVNAGGTATNIFWTPFEGGRFSIDVRGKATFVNPYSGIYYGSANQLLFSGAAMTDQTIDSGFDLYVMSGGMVNGATINANGSMCVFSGGTVSNAVLNPSGGLYVYADGVANGITVNSGTLGIASGGTAEGIDWTPCEGHVVVADGGNATFVSSYSGVYYGSANQLLSQTENLNSKVLGESEEMYVMSGGSVKFVIIREEGNLYVSSGGTVDCATISSGSLNVAGGTVNSAAITSGVFNVCSGGQVDSVSINYFGSLTLSDGTADNTELNSSSFFFVSSGGTAKDTTVNSNGMLFVYSGGTANDTVVNYNGQKYYSSAGSFFLDGGTANRTTLEGGMFEVYSGGIANDTTVNILGDLIVSSGGTTNRTALNFRGAMYVCSGGVANDVQVNYYGGYHVSGGTANRTTLTGLVVSSSGGGRLLIRDDMSVLDGGIANDTLLESAGSMTVSSGGTANGVTINSGGRLKVSSGGTASGIADRGNLIVLNSGFVQDAVIYSGASLSVSSGGLAQDAVICSGASFFISSGGMADHVTLQLDGYLAVSSGGTATNIVWTPGTGKLVYESDTYLTFASTYSGVYYTKNDRLLSHAMTMDRTTVSSSYQPGEFCSMYIFSGGTANDLFVISSGTVDIFSGGIANNATVSDRGTIRVFSGTLNSTVIENYGQILLYNGLADNTFINVGTFQIFSGGTADHTSVVSSGAITVSSGGVIRHTDLTYGRMLIAGGTADTVTVGPCGSLFVYDSGTALNILENGGYVSAGADTVVTFLPNALVGLELSYNQSATLHSGTTATDTILDGGSLDVFSGGAARGITGSSGGIRVFSGGIASDIALDYYAGINVSGGAVSNVDVRSGRLVVSGGTADNITMVKSGTVYVSDGTVNNLNLLLDGSLYISSGGTVRDVNLGRYLYVVVSEGGMLTGQINLTQGVFATMQKGSILDFDLTRVNPGDPILVNDLSLISGTPTFTLTVSDTQAQGVYVLTEGVDQFDSVIKVRGIAGNELGTISLDSSVSLFGNEYTLHLIAGDLLLTVGCEPPQPAAVSSGNVLLYETGNVNAGEVSYRTVVSNGGILNVNSDGLAKYTVVSSGGILNVFEGGAVSKATVFSSGLLSVSEGGLVKSSVIENYGSMCLSGNARAEDVTLCYGVHFDMDGGGTADNTSVFGNEAVFNVISGVANNTVISGSGAVKVFSDGTVNNTIVDDSGASLCLSGGNAVGTVVNGGRVIVSSGGTANYVAVNSGSILLYSSGTADMATINSGALWLIDGGSANSATINSSGYVHVSSGCIANAMTLNSGGSLIVSWCGSANSTTVNPGARIIFSGGTATNIIENGGYVSGATGNNATFAPHTFSEVVLSANQAATVHSGTTAYLTTLNSGGRLELYSGGTVNNTIVNSGCGLDISSGIIANSTVLNPGGKLYLFSGGTAADIIENGGYVNIADSQNAFVSFLPNTFSGELSSCSATVHSPTTATDVNLIYSAMLDVLGGSADSITVNSGCLLSISSGGKATSILENGGFVNVEDGLDVSFVANAFSGIAINSFTSASLHSGTTATQTKLEGGELHIFSGGTADDITVNNGYVFVFDGGILNNVTANLPKLYYYSTVTGNIAVSSGGIVNDVTLNGYSYLLVSSGGIANSIEVNPGSEIIVCSGGTAVSVVENGGFVSVDKNAEVTFIPNIISGIVLSGYQNATVHSMTKAFDISIASGARFDVLGGTAEDLKVGMYGHLEVRSGMVNSTTVSSGGSVNVYSGGTAGNIVLNTGGSMYVSSGGTANDTVIDSDCCLTVGEGGIVLAGILNGGSMYVASGGSAVITRFNGGTFNAESGAKAMVYNFEIHNGKALNAPAGISCYYATVYSGGELNMNSGSVLSGAELLSGGYIYLADGVSASDINIASGGYLETADSLDLTNISLEQGAYFADVVNDGSDVMVLEKVVSGNLCGKLDNAVISGTLMLAPDAAVSRLSGNYVLDLSRCSQECSVIANDFSQAQFIFGEEAQIDLSGNYWGTTDLDAIYARLGVDSSRVRIDDVLSANPMTSVFAIKSTDLEKNHLNSDRNTIRVTFTGIPDASTVSKDAVTIRNRTGEYLDVKDIQVSDNQIVVSLNDFEEEGVYTLEFSSSIADTAGHRLSSIRFSNLSPEIGDRLRFDVSFSGPVVLKSVPTGDVAGTIDAFHVYFNKAVALESLEGNVSLIAPDGTTVVPESIRMLSDSIAEFRISPRTAEGSYLIHVSENVTDCSGNKLNQNGTGPNGEADDDFTGVFNLTDIDLTVCSVDTETALTPGQQYVISWDVVNESGAALVGSWTDGVYLSSDSVWDINDKLLATYVHENGLSAGETLSAEADFTVSGITEGNYYLLVRTDINNEEDSGRAWSDAAQNLYAVPVSVSIESLSTSSAAAGHISAAGDFKVYRFAQRAGEAMSISLDSFVEAANMEIYVGYGTAPTREKYDKKLQRITDGSISLDGSGTDREVYVMVYAKSVPSAFDYSFVLESAPLSVEKVMQSSQDSSKTITLTISGTRFTKDTRVFLIDESGQEYALDNLVCSGSTKLTATIAAGTLTKGNYTLKVTDAGTAVSSAGKVTIAPSGSGNLEYHLSSPGTVGASAVSTLSLTVENTGNGTAESPLIIFTPTRLNMNGSETMGALLSLNGDDVNSAFWISTTPVGYSNSLSFIVSGENVGEIAPGESITIPITYIGWDSNDVFNSNSRIQWNVSYLFSNSRIKLDWAALFSESRLSPEVKTMLYRKLSEEYGNNWGGFYKMATANLEYLDSIGDQTAKSIVSLLSFEVMKLAGVLQPFMHQIEADDFAWQDDSSHMNISRAYSSHNSARALAGSFGYGWSCNMDIRLEIESDGSVLYLEGDKKGYYQPNYTNGYQSVVEDGSKLTKTSSGYYRLTLADGTVRQFDRDGVQTSFITADGERVVCAYDSEGRLIRLSNISSGIVETITRDSETGFITSVSDNSGHVVNYFYEDGDLVRVENVSTGETVRYEYYGAVEHELTRMIVGDTVTSYEYDDRGRLSVWKKGSGTIEFSYGQNGETTMTASNGESITMSFRSDGKVSRVVDNVSGIVYDFKFDKDGNFLSGTGSDGSQVTGNLSFFGETLSVCDNSHPEYSWLNITLPNPPDNHYEIDGIKYYKRDADGNFLTQDDVIDEYQLKGYDADKQLVWYEYRKNGVTVSYSYRENGTVYVSVDNPDVCYVIDGIRYLKTDVDGNILPQSDTLTDSYTTGFDETGRRVSYVTCIGETVTTNIYHEDGTVTASAAKKEVAPNYESHGITYVKKDMNGRILPQSDTTTDSYTIGRDADGKLVSYETLVSGVTTTYTYTADGAILIEKNDPSVYYEIDGIRYYKTDAEGNSLPQSDTETDNTILGYDKNGNIVYYSSQTDGENTSFVYDSDGYLLSMTDVEGTTVYTYDADGNRVTETCSDGTAYVYNAAGLVTRFTDSDGTVTSYEYDANGNLSCLTEDGQATFYVYSEDGTQLLSETDPQGNVYEFTYDDDGRQKSITVNGKTTQYTFDANGNYASITDAAGGTSYYEYNENNKLTKFTDAGGNSITYTYREDSSPLQILYADGTTEKYSYDEDGNLTGWTGRAGQTASYVYNEDGELLSITYSDGKEQVFAYDANGNLVSLNDIAFSYDAENSLTGLAFADGRQVNYTYTVDGLLAGYTDEFGHGVSYTYTDDGAYDILTDESGALIVDYDYDDAGRLVRIAKGNGTYTNYVYDAFNQVTAVENYSSAGNLESFTRYTYDSEGMRTAMETQDGSWAYSYDVMDQLTGAVFTDKTGQVTQNLSYEYDLMGNRTKSVENGVTTTYTYNELNQIVSANGFTYLYDANGNLLEDEKRVYTWTADNRVASETLKESGQVWEYAYDAFGNRVSSTTNGVTTTWTVDADGNVLAEYVDGVWNRLYYQGNRIAGFTDKDGNTYYFNADALGTTLSVTGGDGSAVNSYTYDPFGNLLSSTENVDNAFTFVGGHGLMRNDSGTYFVRARNYDPETGRWISPDPFGIDGGENLYVYTGNCPVLYIDKNGEWTIDASVSLSTSISLWDTFHIGIGGTLGFIVDGEANIGIYFTLTSEASFETPSGKPPINLSINPPTYNPEQKNIYEKAKDMTFTINFSYEWALWGLGISKNITIVRWTKSKGLEWFPTIKEEDVSVQISANIRKGITRPIEKIKGNGAKLSFSTAATWFLYSVKLGELLLQKRAVETASAMRFKQSDLIKDFRMLLADKTGSSLTNSIRETYSALLPHVTTNSGIDCCKAISGTVAIMDITGMVAAKDEMSINQGRTGIKQTLWYKKNENGTWEQCVDPTNIIQDCGTEVTYGVAVQDFDGFWNEDDCVISANGEEIQSSKSQGLGESSYCLKTFTVKAPDHPDIPAELSFSCSDDGTINYTLFDEDDTWSSVTVYAMSDMSTNVENIKVFNPPQDEHTVSGSISLPEKYQKKMKNGESFQLGIEAYNTKDILSKGVISVSSEADGPEGVLSSDWENNTVHLIKDGKATVYLTCNATPIPGTIINEYVWSTGAPSKYTTTLSVKSEAVYNASTGKDDVVFSWIVEGSTVKSDTYTVNVTLRDSNGNVNRNPISLTLKAEVDDWEEEEEDPPPDEPKKKVPPDESDIVVSLDPNDKTVMEGFGDEGYVAPESTLSYKVEFENDPEFATAPARWVRVYDTLDAEKFDIDSFELQNFCIAGNFFEVGDGRDSFNDTVQLKIYDNTVTATIAINLVTDEETGVTQLVADFMAIDPDSGFMLQDLVVGLLPVNDAIGAGEGYINYTINAKPGLAHGAELTNTAKIYFDFNDPIDTPTTLNTVDSMNPTLSRFDVSVNKNVIGLSFDGEDAGSGIAGYNVMYSTDGETFASYGFSTYSELTMTGAPGAEYFFTVQAVDNVGNVSEWSGVQSAVVSMGAPENLNGTRAGLTWDAVDGATGYVVEYSIDGFEHFVRITTESSSLDSFCLPLGDYQWRVRIIDGDEWVAGENISVEADTTAPQLILSDEDGGDDLFFAAGNGTWSNLYHARHVGSVNDWTGTKELVSAKGKGRIQNLYFGSADPNVLCLTDGDNGDAIFVDDVFTDLPENVAHQTARLYRIREIRAGAGDDIVDMTSQQFEYEGGGMTIRGGDGDDTLWANKGSNSLFGDSGNDRIIGASGNDVIAGGFGNDSMHGGGGEDIFTFCDDWGADTVEQLAGGSVTLWFASESASGVWDDASRTYTDGENSVTVKGDFTVNLKFGSGTTPEDAARFAALSDMGAFDGFTSRKVFEESGSAVLANP